MGNEYTFVFKTHVLKYLSIKLNWNKKVSDFLSVPLEICLMGCYKGHRLCNNLRSFITWSQVRFQFIRAPISFWQWSAFLGSSRFSFKKALLFLNHLFGSRVTLISSISMSGSHTAIAAGPRPAPAWQEPVEFWIHALGKFHFTPVLIVMSDSKYFPAPGWDVFFFPTFPLPTRPSWIYKCC